MVRPLGRVNGCWGGSCEQGHYLHSLHHQLAHFAHYAHKPTPLRGISFSQSAPCCLLGLQVRHQVCLSQVCPCPCVAHVGRCWSRNTSWRRGDAAYMVVWEAVVCSDVASCANCWPVSVSACAHTPFASTHLQAGAARALCACRV